MAPIKPITVITVSVFISGLCTGHPLGGSRIYRFPENEALETRERSPICSIDAPTPITILIALRPYG